MFCRFYADEPESRSAEFAARVREAQKDGRLGPVSAAHLQGFFMLHKDNCDSVMENIESLGNV